MANVCKLTDLPPKSASKGGEVALQGPDLEVAKKAVRDAILATDEVFYNQIAKQLPTAWQRWKAWTESKGIIGRIAGVGDIQERVTANMNESFRLWETLKNSLLWPVANTGKLGEPPETVNKPQVEYLLCRVVLRVEAARKDLALVDEWNKGNVGDAAIRKTFGDMAETMNKLFEAVKALIDTVADTAKLTFRWLPWVIGGVIVLPFLFRTFSAYKRGGAAAAADEAAGSIERGRARAADAVASGTRKLLTRGMAGVKRRRNRR